jgi:hypothetical protein
MPTHKTAHCTHAQVNILCISLNQRSTKHYNKHLHKLDLWFLFIMCSNFLYSDKINGVWLELKVFDATNLVTSPVPNFLEIRQAGLHSETELRTVERKPTTYCNEWNSPSCLCHFSTKVSLYFEFRSVSFRVSLKRKLLRNASRSKFLILCINSYL